MLLAPLLAGTAILCLLCAIAISVGQSAAKQDNPLALEQTTHDEIARQLTVNLEGTPTPVDIRRAQRPLSERKRLLHAHPYFSLYKIAKQRFDVSWYLVASVHYQETGFGEGPNSDVVMAIAADLHAHGARNLGSDAKPALAARYGSESKGRLTTAMILERARAWRLLGTLPLPGSGELATPVRGVVGGCGYFGCPRPGHLHNGVDFLAPTGTPVHAADAGVVESVESPGESGGYGNFVCVQHRPHLASCYAHMSAFAAQVHPGARVKRGQVIGLVGSTGSSSAPHLHFEVRRGPAACSTCAVDPLPMLSGDVPDTALPKMVGSAPVLTRAASSSGPLAIVPAPAPAPAAEENSGGVEPAEEATSSSRRRHRPGGGPAATATGGAVPGSPTSQPATPAPPTAAAPAPAAPATPAPPAAKGPAPAAPTSEPGTGGAVAPVSSPPSPSPGPAGATAPPG